MLLLYLEVFHRYANVLQMKQYSKNIILKNNVEIFKSFQLPLKKNVLFFFIIINFAAVVVCHCFCSIVNDFSVSTAAAATVAADDDNDDVDEFLMSLPTSLF